MGPVHESKVAETVPMLCLWECQNKVTSVTQKNLLHQVASL